MSLISTSAAVWRSGLARRILALLLGSLASGHKLEPVRQSLGAHLNA